jgi:5-methylcytosine-specific restriction endonuclease McrA
MTIRKKKRIKIISGVLCNQCTICKEWHPATRDYFYWLNKKKGLLESRCIHCAKKCFGNARKRRDEYSKKYRKENKERILAYSREYCKKNKGIRNVEYKEYNNKTRRKPVSFVICGHQLTIEESPIEGDSGEMLVLCAYCGKYFTPGKGQVYNRINSLKQSSGGESRLYCSFGCASACPVHNRRSWPKGFKPATSREVDPLIRKMCLKRDDYTCQKCGKGIEEIELHCHHIEGATKQPLLANDVENTITLCKECHKWVHKQKNCTYNDLRCK